MHISSDISKHIETFSNFVNPVLQSSNEWIGHTVRIIQTLPQQMQQNQNIAITVIASTNLLFFSAVYFLTTRFNRSLENLEKPLSSDQRIFKYLLNGTMTAGLGLAFNLLLTRITQYSLNKFLLAAITITHIVAHLLLNLLQQPTTKYIEQISRRSSEEDLSGSVPEVSSSEADIEEK